VSTIFLDCETLPDLSMAPDDRRALAEGKVPANYSKPETIEKWIAENAEEAWRSTALDATRGRILCVGLIVDDGEPWVLWNEDGTLDGERVVLERLDDVLAQNHPARVVAHNGHGFDFPWLARRAMRHDLPRLSKHFKVGKPWEAKHLVDTLEVWAAPDRATRGGSLDAICRFLGLNRGANPISGADVYQRWVDGDHDAIRDHVLDDVRQLRAVHRRFVACGWWS
jgi:uncharacterized protein YprB with RNaseH-like and TPR domain